MKYFETTFPQVTHFGEEGSFTNPAEWIVDLTTKVSRTPHVLLKRATWLHKSKVCHVKQPHTADIAACTNLLWLRLHVHKLSPKKLGQWSSESTSVGSPEWQVTSCI